MHGIKIPPNIEDTVSTSEFIRESSSPFWPMADTLSYRALNMLP